MCILYIVYIQCVNLYFLERRNYICKKIVILDYRYSSHFRVAKVNFREKYEASNVIDVMYDIFYVSDSEISEAAILENSTAIKTIEELTSWEWLY